MTHAETSPNRILIVDDVPGNVRLIGAALRSGGYRVNIAESGRHALQVVAQQLPDLILLDVIMPDMDGFQTIEALKSDARTSEIPVLFMSAATETVDRVRGLRLGAVDYIPKPVAPEELLARVRTHMDLKNLRDELREANAALEQRVVERTSELQEELERRIEAEQALRQSERSLATLISNLPGAVVRCRTDPERTVLYASAAMEELSGVDANVFVVGSESRGLSSIIEEIDREEALAAIDIARRSLSEYNVTYRIRTPGGELRWVQERGRIVVSELDGAPIADGVLLDVTERYLANERVRTERAQLMSIFDGIPDIVHVTRADNRELLFANRAFRDRWGSGLGRKCFEVVKICSTNCDQCPAPRGPGETSIREMRVGEDERWFRVVSHDLIWPGNVPVRFTMLVDIHETKIAELEKARLEAQLRHAQKMEAVGQLAGGVAHDFNNILTAILWFTDMSISSLERRLGAASPELEGLREIGRSSARATDLTRQLLTFSRRQVARPKLIDLNAVSEDLRRLLRRLLPGSLQLHLQLSPEPVQVFADVGQIEQVIVNLVVNARDAIDEAGSITLETGTVELSEEDAAKKAEVSPGCHAFVAVRDNGKGIPKEIASRIFEPFFTTKGPGKGTGLGLSTAYGIVKQSGGYIDVESQEGVGTEFRVCLPVAEEGDVEPVASEAPQPVVPTGNETILVVEDDEVLRRMVTQELSDAGYEVLVAEDGNRALEVARQHRGTVHLLISDVVLPGLNGREVSEAMTNARPDLRTLYMSGYAYDALSKGGRLVGSVDLLEKPFARDILLARVRAALDRVEPRSN